MARIPEEPPMEFKDKTNDSASKDDLSRKEDELEIRSADSISWPRSGSESRFDASASNR